MTTWRDYTGVVHECDRMLIDTTPYHYFDTRCLFAMAIRKEDVTGVIEPVTCLFCITDKRWEYCP